jgi:hypothetical protein
VSEPPAVRPGRVEPASGHRHGGLPGKQVTLPFDALQQLGRVGCDALGDFGERLWAEMTALAGITVLARAVAATALRHHA